MNIGQAAQACGLPEKTIRFYEQQGLVVPERHPNNRYRSYSMVDIERLRLLRRARALGFGIDECRELLLLDAEPHIRDEQVQVKALAYLTRLDQQAIALAAMRKQLEAIVDECALERDLGVNAKSANQKPPFMAFTLIDQDSD